jgi:hypothetical protein
MRLERIQALLKERQQPYSYVEEDACGSIDFDYRGIAYHIWEFNDQEEWGAETNVKNGGYSEDLFGDYESEIIRIIEEWQ